MINRPRCRDWTPLATQQLRLRNLIQITGHNIVADANTSIYFTLHSTLMSAPFFTSERLESFRNAIWAEINCQSIHKSASQSVVVRVWQTNRCRTTSNVIDTVNALHVQATSNNQAASSIDQNGSGEDEKDRMLFVWGVYFSGLVPITKRSDVKMMNNALIFYIHGGFFTSANYLLSESVPKQYNNFFQKILPQISPGHTKNTIRQPTKAININAINTNRNCDKSNSNKTSNRFSYDPNERRSDVFVATPIWSQSVQEYSPKHSNSESSCEAVAIDEHLLPSSSDCTDDDENNVLKVRYLDKEYFKWEIRRSYKVNKLLALQEKQRKYRRETLNAKELMDKICMKSASCLNLQLIANKGMLYRPRANPSLGRTLNRLLQTQTEQLKPEDLLKAQELRCKIETAKFRCRLLTLERDKYKVIVRKLNDKCAKLSDDNIEQESYMMNEVRELSRSRDMAIEQKTMYANKLQIYENVRILMIDRQYQLLNELKTVYSIELGNGVGLFAINGHCLPNTDMLCMYHTMTSNTSQAAASLSIAMGYVAHLVQLCSSILNIPLRNRIIYLGSSSKIRDDKTDLAEHEREFPLFCRNIPPSNSFQYAAFLLNQNISQMKFMLNIHGSRENGRATLPNLLAILSVGEHVAREKMYANVGKTASISMLNIDGIEAPMSSISNTSIDMMFSAPAKKIYSVSDENINTVGRSRPKIGQCKSRGSYSDEQLIKTIDAMTLENQTPATPTIIQRLNCVSEPILPSGQ